METGASKCISRKVFLNLIHKLAFIGYVTFQEMVMKILVMMTMTTLYQTRKEVTVVEMP